MIRFQNKVILLIFTHFYSFYSGLSNLRKKNIYCIIYFIFTFKINIIILIKIINYF